MPELINANPTVLSASAIPSRATKSSPDPFQELLSSHVAPDDPETLDDNNEPERFDAQEIYGILFEYCPDIRFIEYYIRPRTSLDAFTAGSRSATSYHR
jgi:hypothetical protein